jgi:hypothetical protein
MFGLLDIIKMAGAAALAGAVAYGAGLYIGNGRGYDRARAEIAAASLKAELERNNDDKKLRGMSDYDLCVAYLSGRELSVAPCEQLRGLPAE